MKYAVIAILLIFGILACCKPPEQVETWITGYCWCRDDGKAGGSYGSNIGPIIGQTHKHGVRTTYFGYGKPIKE